MTDTENLAQFSNPLAALQLLLTVRSYEPIRWDLTEAPTAVVDELVAREWLVLDRGRLELTEVGRDALDAALADAASTIAYRSTWRKV